MKLDHDACYRAIKANDARFDGIFYTAVKTTGIYCRPVCKVPAPKPENCTFYHTPAEAESQGYRPCLRCRPEMAPEYSDFMQRETLFAMAIAFFDENRYMPGTIGKCAEEIGISARHLNRIFKENTGLSPSAYITTKRLLVAKALLTDTEIPISEIAELSGFGSTARFYAALKSHYKLTPGAIRKESCHDMDSASITLKLYYRPPYDWKAMLNFFKMRAIPHVESVHENTYRRSMRLEKNGSSFYGWLEVRPDPSHCRVILTLSKSLQHGIVEIIHAVKRVFDLDAVPDKMPKLLSKGIRLPGTFDGFEMSVRAILGQQITVKAATTIAGRLAESLGKPIETPWSDVNRCFPEPDALFRLETSAPEQAFDQFGALGIIRSRTAAILALAEKITCGEIAFKKYAETETFSNRLSAIKGIGKWTSTYLTMRGLSWPDAFPVSDAGVKHALMPHLIDPVSGKPLHTLASELSGYQFNKRYEHAAILFAEKYRPWRSYLTLALWTGNCLELNALTDESL